MALRSMTPDEALRGAEALDRPCLFDLGRRFHDGGLVARRDEFIPAQCYPDGDQVMPPRDRPQAVSGFTITVTPRFVPQQGPPVLGGEFQDITQSEKLGLPKP